MFSVVDKNDNTVIFINGCFWHHHENCRMAVIPKTRTDFWIDKFERNRANDARNTEILKSMGWNVITVWECSLRYDFEKTVSEIVELLYLQR